MGCPFNGRDINSDVCQYCAVSFCDERPREEIAQSATQYAIKK